MLSYVVLIHPFVHNSQEVVLEFLNKHTDIMSSGEWDITSAPFSEDLYCTVCAITTPYVSDMHFGIVRFDERVMMAISDPTAVMGMTATQASQYRIINGIFNVLNICRGITNIRGLAFKHIDDIDQMDFLKDLIHWVSVCSYTTTATGMARIGLDSEYVEGGYRINIPNQSIKGAHILNHGNNLMLDISGIRNCPLALATVEQMLGTKLDKCDNVKLKNNVQFNLLAYMVIMGKYY